MSETVMNCLAARRMIATDITNKSNELEDHLNSCATCMAYYEKQLKFNEKLKNAIKVDVPDGLASRIIAEHNFHVKKEKRKQRFNWGAIAASMVLAFVVTTVVFFQPKPAIANIILEHVHEEMWVLEDNQRVTLESLNQLLAPHGVKADETIGHATHAGNCIIHGKFGVHIVFTGENAPVTLIIFPEPLNRAGEVKIGDDTFKGVLMGAKEGTLALLSQDEQSLVKFEDRLRTSLMTFI